jgi:hypothetical protein
MTPRRADARSEICDPDDTIDRCGTVTPALPYRFSSLQPASAVNRSLSFGGLPMPSFARRDECDEIRAVPPDKIVEPRVLMFPRPIEMTERERWQRLEAYDPRSAEMIRAAFNALYRVCFHDG